MTRLPSSAIGRCPRLLAACVLATLGLTRAAQADGEGEKARAVLQKYCYRCHGQDGRSEGGLNVITDLAKLVQGKRVIPGDPEGSSLLRRVVAGEMPPEIDFDDPTEPPPPLPRPSAAEVAALRAWIDAGAKAPAPAAEQPFVGDLEVLGLVEADLKRLAPRSRRWARYFSLVHLANAGDNDDQLQSYRHGLAKLLNSLSWSRAIVVPKAIDPAGLILRIDLRDYLWDEGTWEAIQDENPYSPVHDGPVFESIGTLSACELPIVRADWFVFAASRPPLYHEILRLPETVQDLERKLDVDAAANIRADRVVRAGFGESGVSRNNRLIERHESSHGAYWKSYDFAGNADRRNLFAHPLGPGDDEYAFEHDGGEIIFTLPNGLNGYMLADGLGNRIDKGPTEIVRDPKQSDSAVVNGISCMSCHNRGFIAKEDRVRELVVANRAFGRDVVEAVQAIYPTRERLADDFRRDIERFTRAVKATGASLSQTEPVYALARQFEGDVSLTMAAAESGLRAEEFRLLLAGQPALGQTLGPLLAGGVVKRDAFVDAFPLIVEARRTSLARAGHGGGASRPAPLGGASRPGLVAEFFEGDQFQKPLGWRIDPTVDFEWGDGSPDPAVPHDHFGARWTGVLRPPKAGRYVLRLRSDNGARWSLGGRVLYDALSVHGQHDREFVVDLETEPQAIRLEFLEGIFTSWCQLSWRPPGHANFEPIPADCLSHLRDQEPKASPRDPAGSSAMLVPTLAGAEEHLRDKTLVAWVAAANLDQRGGGVIALDDGRGRFDGIVLGELAPRRWMAGSDWHRRTQRDQESWPSESLDGKTPVQIAIVYRGRSVTIHRNGRAIASYEMQNPPQDFGPSAVLVAGRRGLVPWDRVRFDGAIDDLRVYASALSERQLAGLRPNERSVPAPWAWWSFDRDAEERTGHFNATKLLGGARVQNGRLVLDGRTGWMISARSAETLDSLKNLMTPD